VDQSDFGHNDGDFITVPPRQDAPELASSYNEALALHQAGRLAAAEKIYRQILKVQPNHFDSLHLLGVIYSQRGNHTEALRQIDFALTANPQAAFAHSNRGLALQKLKRLDEALASFDKAIALKPDHAEIYNNRGLTLHELRRLNEALASYNKAIALKPDYAEAIYNRGLALHELKRLDEALASFDRTIALKPDYAEAFNNRGLALHELKRLDDALASYQKAIALNPEVAEASNNCGIALHELNRLDEALASFDKAIALRSDYAEAFNNRGLALQALERLDEALASIDKAIALNPDGAEAFNNRGLVLHELKRLDEALASYDKAIALKFEFAEANWNQSLSLLLLGRFDRGWRQYEWRKRRDKPIAARAYPQPLWLGAEDIAGKTLFVYSEQGFGDTIQFCRYAKLVADLGAQVILEVPKPLISLLANLSGVTKLVDNETALLPFDYQCPLLSLPLAFNTTLSNIPTSIPYLKSNAEKSLFWKERLGKKNNLRVGLVWSGGLRIDQPELWSVNKRRNIPLAKLALLKHPDIEFYSLQKGQPAESELAELILHQWDGPHIVDFTNELNDFSDTAALVENLDLVISVDTSTAHLAGALGKPIWILNRFDTCWRWLLDRTDSPWYPTAKLYRQEKAGDWDEVVQRVKADLICFSTQRWPSSRTA
jgi:tetratricopeptide (TPR) repeat protein